MTTKGQTGSTVPVRSDGLKITTLAAAQPATGTQVSQKYRFWSSAQRALGSDRREVLEISFGSDRLVNRLSFEVGRFPLVLRAEYKDRNGDWQPFTYSRPIKKRGSKRRLYREPVGVTISDAVPARVNSANAAGHPQHFGRRHWAKHVWGVTPVRTSRIRFVLRRNPNGTAPVNPHKKKVPFSLAIRSLTVGYRVVSKADIPTADPESPWASSQDILGSQTVYSAYTQPAERVIDGDTKTYWRSEPQPFPFAVVNMFLDVRQEDGSSPVIDRFWLDPITTGAHVNLYYCDTIPDGDFDGSNETIPAQFMTEVGSPVFTRDGATNEIASIDLGPAQAGVSVKNEYLRTRYDQPWWVGIDARSLIDTTDPDSHPLVTMGNTQILIDGTSLKVIAQSGAAAEVALDPALHGVNSLYRVVVSYHPFDPASQRDAHFRLAYALSGYDPQVSEAATTPLPDLDSPVKVGLHPDPDSTDAPAFSVFGLVVKSETLTEDTEAWFFEEGADYLANPENAHYDRGTAQNARIRIHPQFVTESNRFGIVGGVGNRYGDMEWTPVPRDYTLKQGYMNVPPKRAAFWKFEMTNLLAEVYENFLPIERDVLVFPPDVVNEYQQVARTPSNNSVPPGVNTTANIAQNVAYSDALEAVRKATPDADATTVLTITDPAIAAEAAETGWVWSYRPWHVGSSAPQFIGTRQHRYEQLRVRTSSKVSYFAGIREIQPYRINYAFNDDTPEIVEHFLDDTFLDMEASESIVLSDGGGITTLSFTAKAESKTLTTYREIRGVQFATQETSEVQVISDPDFDAKDLRLWEAYGDATLDLLAPGDVAINRGWFAYDYHDLETLPSFGTYGAMDDTLYTQLEGNNQEGGYAEGGIVSERYTPSGAGKIMTMVRVSAGSLLDGPVIVEIVSAFDDSVVASATKYLLAGEVSTLRASYTPGSLVDRRTYGDLENLSGTLVGQPRTNLMLTPSPAGLGDVGDFQVDYSGGAPAFTVEEVGPDQFAFVMTGNAGNTTSMMGMETPPTPGVDEYEVTPGDQYLFMASTEAATTPVPAFLKVRWFNLAGAEIGTDESAHVVNDFSWEPISHVFTAPPLADRAVRGVWFDTIASGNALNPDEEHHVNWLLWENVTDVEDPLALGYFDGSTEDTGLVAYQWTGIERASASTAVPIDTTYGQLEAYRYYELEALSDIPSDLYVRVRQQGPTDDTFSVHRISLYDSPIAWYFSNDGGTTWWQAIDVRNNPFGVLIFPPSDTPEVPGVGRSLRWRAEVVREGAAIGSLYIRPWYGTRSHTVERSHGLEQIGPNRSVYDDFPATHQHPAWVDTFNPVEHEYAAPALAPGIWRNLTINPSGEGTNEDQWVDVEGGTIDGGYEWVRP